MPPANSEASQTDSSAPASSETENSEEEIPEIPAPDFTLTDQNGEPHTLSDYKGQVVFLNFWATWCGPCKQEMPDIQAMYEEFNQNSDEVVILGVANPKTDDVPYNQDGTIEEVTQFPLGQWLHLSGRDGYHRGDLCRIWRNGIPDHLHDR